MFGRIFAALAAQPGVPEQLMIDITPPRGTSNGGQPAEKGAVPRRIGRTRGGLNSKLHAFAMGKAAPSPCC